MPRPSIETARGWRDKTMVDHDGAPLGHIVHIYLDQVTGEPEWALVTSEQDGRQVFVPLVDAAEREGQIGVPVTRALVSDAPAIRPGRQLSKEATARLHGHYGGAPELRWGSARRMPGGGPPARLRQGLDRARERVPSPAAVGSPRTRRLLAAGAAAAPFAAAGRAVARAGRSVPAPTRTRHPRTLRSRRRRMAGNLKLLAGLAAGTGKAPLAEAAPPAGEDQDRTPSPRSEAGETNGSGHEGGGASPEPGPSTGRRERSRSGR